MRLRERWIGRNTSAMKLPAVAILPQKPVNVEHTHNLFEWIFVYLSHCSPYFRCSISAISGRLSVHVPMQMLIDHRIHIRVAKSTTRVVISRMRWGKMIWQGPQNGEETSTWRNWHFRHECNLEERPLRRQWPRDLRRVNVSVLPPLPHGLLLFCRCCAHSKRIQLHWTASCLLWRTSYSPAQTLPRKEWPGQSRKAT